MTDPAIAATDALLRIVVITVRGQARVASASGAALDLTALIADAVNAPCISDLHRIGLQVASTPAGADLTALAAEVAEMDPAFSRWRAAVLEVAWAGIEGSGA